MQPLSLSISRTLFSSQTETLYPLNNSCILFFLQPLVNSIMLFVSINLPILGILFKMNHKIYVILSGLFYLALCYQGSPV